MDKGTNYIHGSRKKFQEINEGTNTFIVPGKISRRWIKEPITFLVSGKVSMKWIKEPLHSWFQEIVPENG